MHISTIPHGIHEIPLLKSIRNNISRHRIGSFKVRMCQNMWSVMWPQTTLELLTKLLQAP